MNNRGVDAKENSRKKIARSVRMVCEMIHYMNPDPDRLIIAVAGPPASGKSTLAEGMADALNIDEPNRAVVIPMDGFHYDDCVLQSRDLLCRKGSPSTFDVDGFKHLLSRLKSFEEVEVAIPVFDRKLEFSRAGARIVPATIPILIVEGNYLLLNDSPWNELEQYFDVTVMIKEPRDCLKDRLIKRWLSFGFEEEQAWEKVRGNDLPNVELEPRIEFLNQRDSHKA